MRKSLKTALLTSTTPIAFESGKPGWKMDGDKIAVDGSGNPIYINAAGEEKAVQGDTIANLNSEAKGHRTAKENAEAELAKYKDANGKLIDPTIAKKAIETVGNIDAKKLIDSGEVEKVRETMRAEFAGQIDEYKKTIDNLSGDVTNLRVDKVFSSSDFLRDGLAVPRDMFEATFGKNVKIGTDGKPEFYGRDGNRIMSKQNVGEYASGDEALKLMVEQHPQKDVILKAQQEGGSGNGGGGGARGQGRVMKRSDFDALDPGAKAQAAQAMGKNELQIVD